MNLSALNPPQANNLTNPVTDTNATGIEAARFKSEALTGADFASYLHNQVQSLKHTQRPTFAVSNGALPPAAPKTDTRPQPSKSDDQPASAKSATSDAQKASQHRHASAKADRADQSNDRTDSDEKVADRQSDDQVLVAQDAQTAAGDATAGGATAAQATSDVAQEALLNSADKAADLASDNTQASALAAQDASLTTIAVSDKLQIITTANTAASEQSVADFALAMGLDPNQVKTLFGEAAANAAAAKLANSSPSTQQILGINSLPSFGMNATANGPSKALGADTLVGSGLSVSMDSPVSTADFQALQAQAPTVQADTQDLLGKMNNLQIQLGSAQAQMASAASSPVSTLAVLSMMDTQLRAEDIESLKSEFDALSSFDSLPGLGKDVGAAPLPAVANRPAPAHANAAATPTLADNPDMAQTYDKLSQKLTTELAARMHEKLNAGEWKMKFALKPASLGLVDVQLEMRDGKLSAHFQSDTNLTQDLLQNGSQRLKDALADLGLNNASVFVAQGQAQGQGTQGQSAKSGKFNQDNDNREKLSDESGLKIAEGKAPRRDERSQFDSYA
ncbi:MAG: hypothetical protein RL700_742 [Pseudomonadota bacterium]